jgi:hypothetical protein
VNGLLYYQRKIQLNFKVQNKCFKSATFQLFVVSRQTTTLKI